MDELKLNSAATHSFWVCCLDELAFNTDKRSLIFDTFQIEGEPDHVIRGWLARALGAPRHCCVL